MPPSVPTINYTRALVKTKSANVCALVFLLKLFRNILANDMIFLFEVVILWDRRYVQIKMRK